MDITPTQQLNHTLPQQLKHLHVTELLNGTTLPDTLTTLSLLSFPVYSTPLSYVTPGLVPCPSSLVHLHIRRPPDTFNMIIRIPVFPQSPIKIILKDRTGNY